ncbi:NAD-dependent epimerase/dehydratase-like protein [Polyplosphaeria fusca]|uniref:NAD-dependent epimerase/dehydratase-like protein n=1 Tax=Polyplosphaeria fusca TaxID=682080 RepID=A0A9P4V8Q3_9PLEO|nr:NAD-dependent epimerase/dehydratase-like protein [Polyplosphaeria fusca]
MPHPAEIPKRIVFTGGSGLAGQHVINKLSQHGHQILNIDLSPFPDPTIHTLKADLTDGHQTFNSLSCHFKVSEPFLEPVKTPDAVIHFAGIPRPMLVPDNELFRVNTMSSYNVIESACKLGIKKIILASSVTTYGVTYAEGDADWASFPVTEETPTTPMDVYAMSKLCTERIAESFARRFGVDIYCLRIGAVIPEDRFDSQFQSYVEEPEKWKVHGWTFTDARDLGNMCHAALLKDGLGFQIFNAVNDEITNYEETEPFLRRFCPNTPFTRKIEGFDGPISNRKIREMLGFREEFPWRARYKRENDEK